MPFLLMWTLSVVAMLQASPAFDRVTRSNPSLVRAVIDGQTIDVASVGHVRLLGIVAPATGRGLDTAAPFAREARERLAALVLQRWVRLETERGATDAPQRRLAYVVREDGLFVNAALVRDGLARVSARRPIVRLDELRRAEAEAQAFRRGMWGSAPQIPPPGYTRRSTGGDPSSAKSKAPRATRSATRKPKT